MKNFIPRVHRYEATYMGFIVNVYLLELENSVIAVDSAIALSDIQNVRDIVQNNIKKDLAAVLLTHGHPDHYTGAGELSKGYGDIPIIATEGVLKQARTRDEIESVYLAREESFGSEYPDNRQFPDKLVENGDILEFGKQKIEVIDLGHSEAEDSVLYVTEINGVEHVFSGDVVINKMHTFFADVYIEEWFDALDLCLNRFNYQTVFYPGHGEEMGIEVFYWQKGYLKAFLRILKELAQGKEELTEEDKGILFDRMKSYLPDERLLMLTEWNFNNTFSVLREKGLI